MKNAFQLNAKKISAQELIDELCQERNKLRQENEKLKNEKQDFEAVIKDLEAVIKDLGAEIKDLGAENQQLKSKAAKNSSNSSKPPGSEPYKKGKPKSRRKKSGKKLGGQLGRIGKTLEPVSNPNHIIIHAPHECHSCQASLSDVKGRCIETRQVFDIPEPQIEVTEHRAEEKKCVCGAICRGEFPKDVTASVQYGNRVRSIAAYLSNQQLIPIYRLRQIFIDLFGLSISTGTLENINTRLFANLKPFEKKVQEYLLDRKILHADETGMRCESKLHWVHVISSIEATFYAIHPKRGQKAIDAIAVLPKFTGTVIHDHWAPYFSYQNFTHGLCNTHHDRELEFVSTEEKESWAKEMQMLLYLAKDTVDKYRDKGILAPEILQEIEQEYQRIIAVGKAYHSDLQTLPKSKRGRQKQRVGKNLLDRFDSERDYVLRFMYDFEVPFTNNLGEQDIRMMKLKQKISGCFRVLMGGERFCRIRSYISTARKQGWHILTALSNAMKGSPQFPRTTAET